MSHPSQPVARFAGQSFPAWLDHVMTARAADVQSACAAAASYMGRLPHVGGSSMAVRMAERVGNGYTPERAAAREYVYRWSLCLDGWASRLESAKADRRARFGRGGDWRYTGGVFGAPHTLGM